MSKRKNTKFQRALKKLGLAAGAVLLATTVSQAQTITTELDGRRLNFEQPPVMQNGRVLVPLRGIFENLGADVLYSPADRSIKATADNKTIQLSLGQREAFINGQQVFLDVPADTISGRTMVPLRFVSEALGADVKWRSATKTVAISQGLDNNQQVSQNDDQVTQTPEVADLNIGPVVHNARRTLQPGDTLTVTMTGTDNASASFSILGAMNEVTMTEVSPGRYEGRLTIPNGLNVNNGTIVGHLRKNGKEVIQEAARDLSIAASSVDTPITNSRVTNLLPMPSSVTNDMTPTFRAQFMDPIRPETATLTINGQTYRGNVTSNNQVMTFTPQFRMSPGTYNVEAQAIGQHGMAMKKDWTFEIAQQNQAQTSNPTVSISNLSNGTRVPAVFNIQGQTTPYTKVQIDAQSQRALIPGVIGLSGRKMETSTVSDANGRFNVQMNTSNLPSNSNISLDVSVLDSNGQVSDSVELDVIRQ